MIVYLPDGGSYDDGRPEYDPFGDPVAYPNPYDVYGPNNPSDSEGAGGGVTKPPPPPGGEQTMGGGDTAGPAGTGTTDGGGGGDFNYSGGTFNWPQLSLPRFSASPFEAPPPFSYGDFSYENFKPPTAEEAQNEPGYKFALDQGLGALGSQLMSRGIFRSGATPKKYFDYAQNAAGQNFQNVYNRGANTYGINRGNAFGNWNANRENAADNYRTNYGVSRDVFDRNYGVQKDTYAFNTDAMKSEFAPKFSAAQMDFDDAYRRWRDQLNALTSLGTAGAGG